MQYANLSARAIRQDWQLWRTGRGRKWIESGSWNSIGCQRRGRSMSHQSASFFKNRANYSNFLETLMRLYHSAAGARLILKFKWADLLKLNYLQKYSSLRELNITHHPIYCHRAALPGVKRQKRLRGQGIIGNECRDRESIAAFDNGFVCRVFLCSFTFDRILILNNSAKWEWIRLVDF